MRGKAVRESSSLRKNVRDSEFLLLFLEENRSPPGVNRGTLLAVPQRQDFF